MELPKVNILTAGTMVVATVGTISGAIWYASSQASIIEGLTQQVETLTIENNATDRTNLIRDVEQMARTAVGLRQTGFEQARRAAEADIAREMEGRRFQAGLLGGLGAEQAQRLGMLGQIGEQQRLLQQQALQVPYQEFQRALAYGPQQLGLLQAGLGTTTPITTTQQKTGLGDVLGTAAQLYGLTLLPG